MATITVRGLDPEVQHRLKMRAAANNRSMESEARAILSESVRVDTFTTDWLEIASTFRGEFEAPSRSMPRDLDLT